MPPWAPLRAIFIREGGGGGEGEEVNHLPKTFLQVAQIFMKQYFDG